MTADTIEREAKLFEAGSYPERGVEITEEDLDRIAASTADAPIRIEHTPTPFDGALGVLKSVYRKGKELFGRLCFTRAAWELVKAANARRLSVAIKTDKSGIAEVSLVREPRIADAAVFGEVDLVLGGEVDLEFEAEFAEPAPPPDPEVERLQRELVERDTRARIDQLKRAGKLAPASEVFARAILESGDSSVITFGGTETPISQVFLWFLDSQPKVIEFAELAAAAEVEPDEPEIFAKLGITSERAERYRTR